MMDAGAMTELASRWKNVPTQHTCEVHGPIIKRLAWPDEPDAQNK